MDDLEEEFERDFYEARLRMSYVLSIVGFVGVFAGMMANYTPIIIAALCCVFMTLIVHPGLKKPEIL